MSRKYPPARGLGRKSVFYDKGLNDIFRDRFSLKISDIKQEEDPTDIA